jgi:hypothetical protein
MTKPRTIVLELSLEDLQLLDNASRHFYDTYEEERLSDIMQRLRLAYGEAE